MDFLKSITGKVVTGVVALAVITAAISWFSMDPADRADLLRGTGKVFAWLGVVLLLPWATFFVIGGVSRLDNNFAGAGLVAGYTLVELLVLLWLFDWTVSGATAWIFLIVGVLFAAVYNLFTCDWIAEKVT